MGEDKKNEPAIEEVEKAAEKAAAQPDGLVITVEGDKIQVQTLGSTKVLEAPTILKLATKQVEEQLGI